MIAHKHADKGQKIFCQGCGHLIAVFRKEVFSGQQVSEDMFTEEGQGPWEKYESMVCRNCNEPWKPDQRWFTEPDLENM